MHFVRNKHQKSQPARTTELGRVAAGLAARWRPGSQGGNIMDYKFKVIYKFGTFRRNQIIQMSTTSKYAKFHVKFSSVQVD